MNEDAVSNNGEGAAGTPPEPPPLTPEQVEKLMDRMLVTPEFASLLNGTDMGPLCMAVQQCTRGGGPEAMAITIMCAAWGILTYGRLKQQQQGTSPEAGS